MSDFPTRLQSAIENRYTMERKLGRGGMATVYLATDLGHHRQVAIKVLDPEVARVIGPQRFLREIQISARLTHPHILPLHDSGEGDGFLYYVMPYLEGDSLRARLLREGHLGLDETVRIIGQVAAALDHAHHQGVVHRDIKPENILFSAGEAMVTDFGIARVLDAAGTERLTETGLAVGTPAYMSPEQAGAARLVDGRADVYSLGCVAYEMLGGEPPFSGASPLALMARHAVDPVPSLRTLRSTTPRSVEKAIEQALAKVPADRFATAGEFAAALVDASSTRAIAREERRSRGRQRRRYALVAAVTVLVAAAGWWVIEGSGGSGIHRFAVLPLDSPNHDPAQDYFVEGVQEELISQLARDGLGVIARTSVMQYRDTNKPVREIARELGVDAVVEASLTRSGDSVAIEAGLVDGHTEQYLWSHAYGMALQQLPLLTRDLAQDIARAIRPGQRPRETPAAASRAVDPQVYDAYLQGQFHRLRPGREELETARQYFQLALAKDSTYAPAYAGLSEVWAVGRQRGYFTPQEATPRADSAAYEALALDSTLAEPHFALAMGRLYGHWDWHGAEPEFRRTLQLSPDNVEARIFYAHLLCILHRPAEALDQMNRARELDPVDPVFAWLAGMVLTMVGRYDDAIALYRAVLAKAPDNASARWLLWSTLHSAGRYPEAFEEIRRWAQAAGDSAVAAALDRGRARGGYTGAIRAAADYEAGRSRTTRVSPWEIAIWYAAAGAKDRAMDWLERSFEAHEPAMPYLAVHPAFRDLHDDPRFQQLVQRMNLPR